MDKYKNENTELFNEVVLCNEYDCIFHVRRPIRVLYKFVKNGDIEEELYVLMNDHIIIDRLFTKREFFFRTDFYIKKYHIPKLILKRTIYSNNDLVKYRGKPAIILRKQFAKTRFKYFIWTGDWTSDPILPVQEKVLFNQYTPEDFLWYEKNDQMFKEHSPYTSERYLHGDNQYLMQGKRRIHGPFKQEFLQFYRNMIKNLKYAQ